MGAGPPCGVCRGSRWRQSEVLWPALVQEWGLSPQEESYIQRQQGALCLSCGCSLRSSALACALAAEFGARDLRRMRLRHPLVRILEINKAGTLHRELRRFPRHRLASYPQVDMQSLPFPDGSFDVVLHSDTLEHVPDPVQGLRECLRVLRPSGLLCFTVPIVVDRATRRRDGLPPSYHGTERQPEYLVVSEYGADAWCQLAEAGAEHIGIFVHEYPAALALVARRTAAKGAA